MLLQAGACSRADLEVPELRPLLWDQVLCLTKVSDCVQYKGHQHWVAVFAQELGKAA